MYPREQCKTIYDKYCVNVRVCDIAKYYGMPRSTASGIIYRLKKTSKTFKVQERPLNLSERGERAFKNCVLENCFQPLRTIVARFNKFNGLNLSGRSGRRYMKHLKMDC